MHELSLAENIADIANKALQEHNKTCVHEIILDIGALTCVEPEALRTALDVYASQDNWQHVTYVFNEIKGVGKCLTCENQFEIDDFFAVCPHCQGMKIDILEGKEFKIKSITME
jgi:hydrogenase nickel incorporation protein HypA/HybF